MISIIIPARNEEQHIVHNIRVIKDTLNLMGLDHEIILIDDCSSDDTYLKVMNLNDIYLYRKTVQQGKGAAIKTGWKVISKSDYVVITDADLQISPEEIKVFLNQMKHYNADVVVGNKRHLYSSVQYSFLRKIVSNGYNILVRLLFGVRLRDTQCGLKLFKRKVLDKIMPKILVKQFAFDLEVLVALRDNGYRIVDAPVHVKPSPGKGSVNIYSIIETFKDTIAVFYRRQKGWYR